MMHLELEETSFLISILYDILANARETMNCERTNRN